MNDYARATGGSVLADRPVANHQQPLPTLSAAQEARTAEAKAFVQEQMPDFIPLLRELVAAGYVPGWRAVENCKLLSEKVSK